MVLVTCNNKEDPMKNEGARVVTTLSIDFSDAHEQLTPKSVMESCNHSFYGLSCYLQEGEHPSKNDCTRVVTTFLPL